MAKRRQHYVPQGYLKLFSPENETSMIWVYEKILDRRARKVSTKQVAYEDFYYHQEKDDGEIDTDTMEDALARDIDEKIPKIIKNITTKPHTIAKISEDDRVNLAFFIGLSITRGPSFREGIQNLFTSLANTALSSLDDKDIPDELVPYRKDIKATAKDWVSLEPMITGARDIGNSVLAKSWQFYVPPKNFSLITSDNPALISGPSNQNIGPAHPNSEIIINLRPDLSLVCTPKKSYPQNYTFQMSPTEARKFNKGIIRAARRFIFSNSYDEKIEYLAKKTIGMEQKIS